MAASKQYGSAEYYEKKLVTVMERMGASEYKYNFDRFGAWVEFWLNGQMYKFDHTREKSDAHGIKLNYGSDCFAQIVLSLEDLARMAERGIYELQTWLAGMKYLPPAEIVPDYIRLLGFDYVPADAEDVKARFRGLAKQFHPDGGGTQEQFVTLQDAANRAIEYINDKKSDRIGE